MPTIITHAAVPILLGHGVRPRLVSTRLLVFSTICAAAPDLDVVGFKFGVQYAELLGHRGLTHSLAFALGMGLVGALFHRLLDASARAAFFWSFLAVASHILLDAMTNGGLGVAVLWPLDETRYFAPFRPIVVSPFSPKQLLGAKGVRVVTSELLWVWLPVGVAGLWLKVIFGYGRPGRGSRSSKAGHAGGRPTRPRPKRSSR